MQSQSIAPEKPTTTTQHDTYTAIGNYLVALMERRPVTRDSIQLSTPLSEDAAEILSKAETQAEYFARQFCGGIQDTSRYNFALNMLWEYARHIAPLAH